MGGWSGEEVLPSLGLPAFSGGGTMMSMPQAALGGAYPGLQGLWGPVTQAPPTGMPPADSSRLNAECPRAALYCTLHLLLGRCHVRSAPPMPAELCTTAALLCSGSCMLKAEICESIPGNISGPAERGWKRRVGMLLHCRIFSARVDPLAYDASLLRLRSSGPPVCLSQGPPHAQWNQGRAV